MSADGAAITHVTLCSGEIPSSEAPCSVLFFLFLSGNEFKSKTVKVAAKNF